MMAPFVRFRLHGNLYAFGGGAHPHGCRFGGRDRLAGRGGEVMCLRMFPVPCSLRLETMCGRPLNGEGGGIFPKVPSSDGMPNPETPIFCHWLERERREWGWLGPRAGFRLPPSARADGRCGFRAVPPTIGSIPGPRQQEARHREGTGLVHLLERATGIASACGVRMLRAARAALARSLANARAFAQPRDLIGSIPGPRQQEARHREGTGLVHLMERATGIEPASSAWKAEVLPLNYARDMVGTTGFEPATSCSQSRRATKLRHVPKVLSS